MDSLSGVDMVVDIPVVQQRQGPTVETVQNTVVMPQLQSSNKVVDMLVVVQRQVPQGRQIFDCDTTDSDRNGGIMENDFTLPNMKHDVRGKQLQTLLLVELVIIRPAARWDFIKVVSHGLHGCVQRQWATIDTRNH